MTFSNVLLPAPEGPIIAVSSPDRKLPFRPCRISLVTARGLHLRLTGRQIYILLSKTYQTFVLEMKTCVLQIEHWRIQCQYFYNVRNLHGPQHRGNCMCEIRWDYYWLWRRWKSMTSHQLTARNWLLRCNNSCPGNRLYCVPRMWFLVAATGACPTVAAGVATANTTGGILGFNIWQECHFESVSRVRVTLRL